MRKAFDVIVVGSGAGGAAVAYELAKRGKKVLVLEAGPTVRNDRLGTIVAAAMYPGYYHKMAIFSRSVEGSIIYYTCNLGGTTVFACGNMTRSREIEERFSLDFGMTGLSHCFDEAEDESSTEPLPVKSILGASRRLMEAACRNGYDARPATKGNACDPTCQACGNCVFGCRQGAKWDSRFYLASAPMAGATIRTKTRVERLLLDGDVVTGVVAAGKGGKERIEAETVVLAAGAMNTPVILQRSGIESGKGLFVDYFSCLYGTADGANQLRGRTMATFIDRSEESGFIISPYIDDRLQYLLFCPMSWQLRTGFSRRRTLGLMVKIADERSGEIRMDGTVHKKPTEADRSRMEAGKNIAKEILRQSGAKNLTTTKIWRGAHPGGTAAIGEVIDNNLRVRGTKGLYVCDASMFPSAPGLPPILTITAVGKWLGKRM